MGESLKFRQILFTFLFVDQLFLKYSHFTVQLFLLFIKDIAVVAEHANQGHKDEERHKNAQTAALLFFAKFVLEVGDTFQPIPAVLNSSVFLTVHVFTIALGFAGMILSGVVSHLVLFRGSAALPSAEQPKGSPLYSLMYATLVFGAVFTVIGTLLGGVWADFAWGRFWGFDPKECGALFVILWAMLALHLRAGKLVSLRGFAIINCFNVIVTFLCWFGVNLLGVGLHSYGFQSNSVIWLVAFIVVDLIMIALLTYRLRRIFAY